MKSQSAMEYLMTYGWAILIIAIVLVAFFSLGLFNPYTFKPKASPGSCQVVRPNGPGTSSFVSLVGTCLNEIPQSVASFNGSGSIVIFTPTQLPSGASTRTITAWVYSLGGNPSRQRVVQYGIRSTSEFMGLIIEPYTAVYFWGYADDWESPLNITNNTWEFIAVTYNGGTSVTAYMDNQSASGNISYPLTTPSGTNLSIGYDTEGDYYKGKITNIQIYNTSLSANEILSLYNEGIGGKPIDIQHIVGWWPLNGNAYDYSGNNNNGTVTNVTFTSDWETGYTAPS